MFENLPKNWKENNLKNLITYYIGGDWGEESQISNDYEPVKIIRATDISSWDKIHGKNAQLRYLKKGSIEKRKLENDDIVIEISGGSPDQPVGRTIVIKEEEFKNKDYPYSCSNFFRLLKINKAEVNPEYLNYYFKFLYKTKIIENYQSNSTNLRNLKFKQFLSQKMKYPSTLQEQEEIVKVLNAASDMVRLRKQCIQYAQDLIPAIFQEMFGLMIENTNEHKIFKIKNLGNVITGTTPSSKKENMFGGTIPFVTPGDLENNKEEYERYLTEEGAKNSRMVRAGSTFVCCIGATIGKVDRAYLNSCFNQQINAIEWNKEQVNDIFGLYLFRQLSPLIRAKASHTTLPILNKGNFENITIPIPLLEQQELFAQKAIEIENYIKEQQEELKKSEDLFLSLLHHAFTGELTRHKFGGENEK